MARKRPFRPSHMELRYNTYFAKLAIPSDVQHIIGRKKFYISTGTGDERAAQLFTDQKVLQWKAEIAKARNAKDADDPDLQSAAELSRMLKTTHRSPHSRADVLAVIDEERNRLGHEINDDYAEQFFQVATDKTVLLKSLLPSWQAYQIERGLKQKTVDQMHRDISLMIADIPTVYALTGDFAIPEWIIHATTKHSLSPSSVHRIISSCRNFFTYLQDAGEVPRNTKQPFTVPKESRMSRGKKVPVPNRIKPWIPFAAAEVRSLIEAANDAKDPTLAKLIRVAAYTGARIEELCSLRKFDVDTHKMSIKITDAKTEAGIREIPIHSALKQTINELLKSKEDSEYLFPNLAADKYGRRSSAIGKRFTRLKTRLGYGETQVFHSIRKTFTTALENASVPENITADIIGHVKQTMTYGLYSGGASLGTKRDAIEKILYSPPL